MRIRFAFLGPAVFTAASTLAIQPSAAAVIYPWCLEYGGTMGGAENCGFVNFAQCQASRLGTGGFCKPNRWYSPNPASPRGAPPTRR
jgi:Protein of unknown function (DUF3551)